MIEYWIWLSQRKALRNRMAIDLLHHFGSPRDIYLARPSEISAIAGTMPRVLAALEDKDLRPTQEILDICYEKNIHIITLLDSNYPAALRAIEDPPLVLYYRGRWPSFDTRPTIAAIGARQASAYGLTAAKRIGYQLARSGAIVVSGIAKGIDAAAMSGALTGGESVVGVLGCGVDVVYPKENKSLFEDTLAYGCLVSEYPPGTPPFASHFPARNRIISGLSDGVLVVEASTESGALITVRSALEQGRDVFAVPGNIGVAACEGSNRLLKEGAGLVENAWDILQEYKHLYPDVLKPHPSEIRMTDTEAMVASPVILPKAKSRTKEKIEVDRTQTDHYINLQEIKNSVGDDEWRILQTLNETPQPLDTIIDAVQLPAARVLAAMTLLEVKGYVTRQPGNRFLIAKK